MSWLRRLLNTLRPARLDRHIDRETATLDDLRAMPGVAATATSWTLPGAPGPSQTEFEITGRSDAANPTIAGWRTVSPGYFSAMQIPVVAGELCRSSLAGVHRPGLPMNLMVNSSFVRRYFSTASPIGVDLTWDNRSLAGRIVGVVGDARELGVDQHAVPTVYACDSAPNPFPWFLVRTNGDPIALAAVVRLRLKELDPLRSVYDIAPLEQRIDEAYAQNRLRTWLISLFALTALTLVCAGVYGTLSYAVSLRRREVALRLALGALRRHVVQQLTATSIRIVGIAAACGLLLALIFTQSLSTMLYGVTPADPVTLVGVVSLVIVVASAAAIVPAVRAAFTAPMRALREE